MNCIVSETISHLIIQNPKNYHVGHIFQAESLRNPTPAMVALMERAEERERERQGMSWREQLQQITVSLSSSISIMPVFLEDGLTYSFGGYMLNLT